MKKIIFAFVLCSFLTGCASAKGKQDIQTSQLVPEESISEEEAEEQISEPQVEPEKPKPKYTLRAVEGEPVVFTETWGYVSQNRESEYNSSIPVTDVCYFAAEVNSSGQLSGIPVRSKLKTGKNRCHLVIVCDSRSLTHFSVSPNYDVRKKLLNDIVKASAPYDGVQLDFECVNYADSKNYISFIADLRYKLKGKMLSVCVPARFNQLKEDTFPYETIASYCDRVFVMAYDQHWGTSEPGAIAEVEWCKKVLAYAKSSIISRKLIMGIPFYGRTWGNEVTNQAWYFSGANRIMTEHGVETVEYENDIPTFEYTTEVKVKGYFNDAFSCVNLCRIYKDAGVQKVGFWRIGQEDPEFWKYLKTK